MKVLHGPFTLVLALAALTVAPALAKDKARADSAAFVGVWRAGPEQDVSIAAKGDRLHVEGFATWGAQDPDQVANGLIHLGEFSLTVPVSWIEGDTLAFAVSPEGLGIRPDAAGQYDCLVTLKASGDRLMVEDNTMCGGANVTFNGVYERAEQGTGAKATP